MTLRRRLAVLLVCVSTFVAGVSVALTASLLQLRDHRDLLLDRIGPSSVALRDLRAALVDQESGVRGFVLTGDEDFLEPYDRGRFEAERLVAQLRTTLPDDDVLRNDLDAVSAAAVAWHEGTAEPMVALVRQGPPGAAEADAPARQEEGKRQFEQVRVALDALGDDLDAVRDAARDDWTTAYGTVVVLAVLEAVGLVVLISLVAVAVNRLVLRPIHQLGDQVRQVAGGDLDRAVTSTGPPELAQLGDDVEAMRWRIVAELERATAAAAAVEAQAAALSRSNADLEQFAYVASHDLQEPLRKVAGFCQLLQRRYQGQLDDRADEYIAFAVDGAQRMQDLINDLLAFSRVSRTEEERRPVPLADVVRRAVDVLDPLVAEAGATVRVGEDLPVVDGHAHLLEVLFQNLVGNAVKYRAERPPVVTVSVEPGPPGWWEVEVADNGIGIDPEYAERIFQLFGRLHARSEYPGTGIGLAMARRIVEFHGGTIWLHTGHPPPGAAFRFTLPAAGDGDGRAR